MDLRHKAQTLLEFRADAVQAPAKVGVTAGLARATGVVAHIELITALGHGRDPQVKLSQESAILRQCSACIKR